MEPDQKEAVRPMREGDLAVVRELAGDERALTVAGHRAHVVAEDPGAGVAIWIETSAGQGVLSLVVTRSLRSGQAAASVEERRLFYELARACAREALTRGVTVGRFVLHDKRLLDMIARDFDVEPVVFGRDPESGGAVEWEIVVDVADAVRQLDRVLAGKGADA